jgi:tetratricopeptide (TPR) repeat protein
MSETDKYYQILGLNPGVSEEEIKQAYRDLVNVWHPDRFSDPRLKEKANEKLKEINFAYEKLKSYATGDSRRYASSEENYSKSHAHPHEPPPKSEKEQFSTKESGSYGHSEHPPNEPPYEANEARAIWNPNATINWSIPFTPAFGSYLQMLNWRTLGEPTKASSAQSWFYASLLMLFIYFLIGTFVSDREDRYIILWWLSFPYLITWYFAAGRSQGKYVKAKFGTGYPKKPWGQALLIAVGALIGCWVVAVVLGFVFRAMTTKDNIHTASVPPSSSPTVSKGYDPLGIGSMSTQPPPETGLSDVDWYNKGGLFLSSGNYIEAIEAYSKAIALNPHLSAAYDGRAFSYYKLGKLQEAIKDLDKVIEAKPRDAKAYRIRGNLHFDLGNIPESVKDMKIAAELEPKPPQQQPQFQTTPQATYQKEAFIPASEFNKRGVEYFNKAEYNKAIDNFTTALSMGVNPSYSTYIDRGRSYYETKQYDKAIEDFKHAISLAPNNAKAYGWCGIASYGREFYYEAVNYFGEAIELNPNSAIYYLNRGYAYMKIGGQSLAVSDFKKACDLGDEDGCKQLRVLGYR